MSLTERQQQQQQQESGEQTTTDRHYSDTTRTLNNYFLKHDYVFNITYTGYIGIYFIFHYNNTGYVIMLGYH